MNASKCLYFIANYNNVYEYRRNRVWGKSVIEWFFSGDLSGWGLLSAYEMNVFIDTFFNFQRL